MIPCKDVIKVIPHPHLLMPGHQQMVSTSKGCNQWLLLAKTLLNVALAGGNRSLVARTSRCGWAISYQVLHLMHLQYIRWCMKGGYCTLESKFSHVIGALYHDSKAWQFAPLPWNVVVVLGFIMVLNLHGQRHLTNGMISYKVYYVLFVSKLVTKVHHDSSTNVDKSFNVP